MFIKANRPRLLTMKTQAQSYYGFMEKKANNKKKLLPQPPTHKDTHDHIFAQILQHIPLIWHEAVPSWVQLVLN